MTTQTKTIDLKFSELCHEIDYWKSEAEYYKEKYESELRQSIETSNERMDEARKGVANALMFAFSVTDSEDGSLSISPDDRKFLTENMM
jgi:hypothetical protein